MLIWIILIVSGTIGCLHIGTIRMPSSDVSSSYHDSGIESCLKPVLDKSVLRVIVKHCQDVRNISGGERMKVPIIGPGAAGGGVAIAAAHTGMETAVHARIEDILCQNGNRNRNTGTVI